MQWLYKSTDTENEAGRRRPDFEMTSAFALRDGILCRSAYSRRTHRRVNLVWSVVAGDVIHFYHRQWDPPQPPRLIGSFRVEDPRAAPGAASFNLGLRARPGVGPQPIGAPARRLRRPG